jgi:acyl-CoA synthetase (AMP-forming)/AMP-acid ligase II
MQQNSSVCAILDPADFATPSENAIESLPGLKRGMNDIALLQHSSGSTGLQKGVALSHQAIFNQLESYSAALQLTDEDVIVSWLPLYHDMGLIAGFVMPVLCGVPLVLMSPFDWVRAPARLFQAVTHYQGTLTWLPNFAYNFCAQKIRERDLQGVNLSSWRAVINCSEPMYWESHQMFQERFGPYGLLPSALATSYAMAENVFAVTQGGIDAPVRVELVDRERLSAESHAVTTEDEGRGVRMLSAGQPIDNTLVRIQDEQGVELPDRRVGQIAIQSNCMLSGYYKRPNLSQSAFLDGWYLTGDLGYTVEGELYVTGRIKDLIIVGGKNIHPQDLEYLANNVPGVYPGRVAAFGIFNPRLGTEDVVLVAESETEDLAARAAIADAIRSEITRNSDVALRYVQVVPRGWLLKTSSGKISRGANRQKYLDSFQ